MNNIMNDNCEWHHSPFLLHFGYCEQLLFHQYTAYLLNKAALTETFVCISHSSSAVSLMFCRPEQQRKYLKLEHHPELPCYILMWTNSPTQSQQLDHYCWDNYLTCDLTNSDVFLVKYKRHERNLFPLKETANIKQKKELLLKMFLATVWVSRCCPVSSSKQDWVCLITWYTCNYCSVVLYFYVMRTFLHAHGGSCSCLLLLPPMPCYCDVKETLHGLKLPHNVWQH